MRGSRFTGPLRLCSPRQAYSRGYQAALRRVAIVDGPVTEAVFCQRCHTISPLASLLDGEACPRCRLVL